MTACGRGFEIAQAELGECLLTMTSDSKAEVTLFQQEGVFWLERAAFAGDARAQRLLSTALAEKSSQAERVRAPSWTPLLETNANAELYSYKPLHLSFVSDIKSYLTAEKILQAETFATNFSIIRIARYHSLAQTDRSRNHRQRPEDLERRRRPQLSHSK